MDAILQHDNFTTDEQLIADAGKLLSHPARIRILNLLLEHTAMTSGEIAGFMPLGRTTVLQHIAALKDGRWLETTTDGTSIRYRINGSAFETVSGRLENLFRSCSDRMVEETGAGTEAGTTRILFLCTGNSARSQMAEGFINSYADEHQVKAFSAGTRPAAKIQPAAVEVMAEKNIDISSQYPKTAREFIGDRSIDLVIIVCDQAEKECPYLFPYSKHKIFMPFKDPKTLEEFREVRDQIETRLKHLIEEL